MNVTRENLELAVLRSWKNFLDNSLTTIEDGRNISVSLKFPENFKKMEKPQVVLDLFNFKPIQWGIGPVGMASVKDDVAGTITTYQGFRYEGRVEFFVFATSHRVRSELSGKIDAAFTNAADPNIGIPLLDSEPIQMYMRTDYHNIESTFRDHGENDVCEVRKTVYFTIDFYESSEEDMIKSISSLEIRPMIYGKPVADAGLHQVAAIPNIGSLVINLDGSNSYHASVPVITGYSWVQTEGKNVTLNNPNTTTPYFSVSQADIDYSTRLRFDLTVTDSYGGTDSDFVYIKLSPD